MTYVVVDVEADGPCPGLYSMVCFGAVIVDPGLDKTFYGECYPISGKWNPDALKVSGFTREETLKFIHPDVTMDRFRTWLMINKLPNDRLIFVSDNLAFDWQFINYYFHAFTEDNPFGFSGRRIGDVWAGWKGRMNAASEWKKFRRTKHTHNPVDDAKGNAEALLQMEKEGIRL